MTSTYDQIVFFSNPDLYLAAPVTTDQSGKTTFSVTSSLSTDGQALIYGSQKSFTMNGSGVATIETSAVFSGGKTIEFVLYCPTVPTQEFDIISDGQNLISADTSSLKLKLNFISSGSEIPITVSIPIKEWSSKKYVRVNLSDNQATLNVNDKLVTLTYVGSLTNTTTTILGGSYSGFIYLLDGFVVGDRNIDKKNLLNDPGSNYSSVVGLEFQGRTTLFQSSQYYQVKALTLDDFTTDVDLQTGDVYRYTLFVPNQDATIKYVIVRPSDDTVDITTLVNFTTQNINKGSFVIPIITNSTIVFTVGREIDDLQLEIDFVSDQNVSNNTAASIIMTGEPIFPRAIEEGIVNIPIGLMTNGSGGSGVWYPSEFADTPKSVEIVFKPIDNAAKTYIFYSAGGEASYGTLGTLSGFTSYLNGAVVTDLSTMKMNQWNHLVLVAGATMTPTFFLNSSDGTESSNNISYVSLSSYDDQLSANDVEELYSVAVGIDKLVVNEPGLVISEGSFANGEPFQGYSYAWSIVSGGGN